MDGAVKMKANRRMLEAFCTSCGGRFAFGDDVYSCSGCGGFHHAACWESGRGCSGVEVVTGGVVEAPLAPPPEPVPAPEPVWAPAPAAAQAPAPQVFLAADERRCPSCGCAIKQDALKCRFCGEALNSGFGAWQVPPDVQIQISKLAKEALTFGIVGLFCCAPVFGSMAISRGNQANALIDQHPQAEGRGKAKAGVILGAIDWVFFVIGILIQLSNMSR